MNFPKAFPTGFQGAPTCRRSLSPVQMSVGMPGTRLFTRSYTKTFSSQLPKQSNTGQSRGCVSKWSLSTHPTTAPVGKWVPCFSLLLVIFPGLCVGESWGRGMREKKPLLSCCTSIPFSRVKNTVWGNLGNTMPVFLPVQEKAFIFSIAFV